jgi:hypothetical protein
MQVYFLGRCILWEELLVSTDRGDEWLREDGTGGVHHDGVHHHGVAREEDGTRAHLIVAVIEEPPHYDLLHVAASWPIRRGECGVEVVMVGWKVSRDERA